MRTFFFLVTNMAFNHGNVSFDYKIKDKAGGNKIKIMSTIKIKLIIFSFFHIVHENKWLLAQKAGI